jgi:histidinol-phosphate phosphatase family protein
VVLCGGLGTRLRPITDTMPKPMVPVNGRPFLAYLVQQMREQGIRRIMLLTGYRGGMIREFFEDGAGVGVEISYSEGPTEWETGRRIWEARTALDARFLLLYSDNYVPFRLDRLCTFHAARRSAVSLMVQGKVRGNIRLSADGRVEMYDPTRTAPGLGYVEIGYMLVERDAMLAAVEDPEASFSRTLRQLAEQDRLAGMISRDPYHSISDVDRWRLAERYLASKRILLMDRDGTVNRRPPRAEYVTSWEKFHFVEETVEAMRQLAAKGFRFIVLSNQAGIARGMLDADAVARMNERMTQELRGRGIDVLAVYVCPHRWDEGCDCRKPAPGMFFRASAEHLVRLDRTIFIGDDPRDSEAADNAGCLSILVGPERHATAAHAAKPAQVAETLTELVPWIVSRFEEWESSP